MAGLAGLLKRIEALEDARPVKYVEPDYEGMWQRYEAFRAAHKLKMEAYEALTVPEKIVEKRRELAEKVAEWEGRDRNALCVNSEHWQRYGCRLIEIDIEALENPGKCMKAAIEEAIRDLRYQGRPPREQVPIERPSVVATVEAQGDQEHRPPERRRPILAVEDDRLKPYRGNTDRPPEPPKY